MADPDDRDLNEDVDSPNDTDNGADPNLDADDDLGTPDGGEPSGDGAEEQDPEAVKAENAQLKARNLKLFERAKKAEGFKKDPITGKWVKPAKPAGTENSGAGDAPADPKKSDLSQEDLIVIIKADVPEEDVGVVREYAALNKVSIKDALAAPVVKGILAERKEERKTGEATNTGRQRRGTSAPSGQNLLEKADSTGELPEDDAGMKKLAEAQLMDSQ